MPDSSKKDLGAGSVKKLLASMAVPAVVAQVVNLLYNIVDRIYIGHIPGVGGAALTGVGLFSPILMLITAFAMLAGSGGGPLAAIAMGQRENRRAEQILGNCAALLLCFAAILTVLFFIFLPPLLRFFGGSDVTVPYGTVYGRIYVLGSVFVLLVMGLNPFITTQGFPRVSMLTTVIGAVMNIVLDPIFIFVFDLGVAGAAIATVLSQAVSAVWVLRFLSGPQTVLKLRPANLRLRWDIVAPCLALGVSSFVMTSTESLLSVSFTSSLYRYGGDVAVGAMTVLNSVHQLLSMPLLGICHGGQPLLSFNYGARKLHRVREAFTCELTACALYSAVFWLLCLVIPRTLTGVFTDDAALVSYAAWALRIYMGAAFALAFQVCCQQSFLALGQAKVSLFLACLRKLILLIPLIFLLPCFFADKAMAVFLAEPVSDFLAAVTTTVVFFRYFRRLMSSGSAQ